jgi:hypothetical protein
MGAALEAELTLSSIKDVRQEISDYLVAPKDYTERHNQQIPEALAQAAQRARQERNMVLAAALFNRALAYRPSDTRLLAEVAGLARRQRMRKRLASGLVIGAACSVVVGLGALGARFLLETAPHAPQVQPPKTRAVARATTPQKDAGPLRPVQPSAPPAEPAKDIVDTTARPRAPALARPEPVVVAGTRVVRTPVVGPQNARVRIDGELVTWYEPHTLSLGPHTFEFVPPNSECCETSPPKSVEIVAGEGEQVVRGVIRFRPSTLRLQGQDGSRASCGIGDVIVAGSEREIPMNRPSRVLSCTVFPPSNVAGDPKTVTVTLSPGRTSTLVGQ